MGDAAEEGQGNDLTAERFAGGSVADERDNVRARDYLQERSDGTEHPRGVASAAGGGASNSRGRLRGGGITRIYFGRFRKRSAACPISGKQPATPRPHGSMSMSSPTVSA